MKKKLIYIIMGICIATMMVACNNPTIQEENENNTETNENINESNNDATNEDKLSEDNSTEESKPETTKTIVIDPGHSSTGTPSQEPIAPDSDKTKLKDGLGATGYYTNIPEHETNMSVALIVKKELEVKGYNVILTKSAVEESKSNIERAFVGNDNNADLVVRIHADSAENHSAKGASIHVPGNNKYTSEIYEVSKVYGNTIVSNTENHEKIGKAIAISKNILEYDIKLLQKIL